MRTIGGTVSPMATHDDLLRRIAELPEHLTGEIVEGELHVSPRPAGPHSLAEVRIAGILDGHFGQGGGGRGGFWILVEPELRLGHDVLVPDLAAWSVGRLPSPSATHFMVAPDLVCEVLSPSNAAFDRGRKMRRYLAHGVPLAWFVDPVARSLEVYRAAEGRWVVEAVHGGADVVRLPPFEELEVDLARWWLPESAEAQAPR